MISKGQHKIDMVKQGAALEAFAKGCQAFTRLAQSLNSVAKSGEYAGRVVRRMNNLLDQERRALEYQASSGEG